MSTEINTRGSIREKISAFPPGNDAECLSREEIITQGNGSIYIMDDYKDSECPILSEVMGLSGTYTGTISIRIDEGTEEITNKYSVSVKVENAVATMFFPKIMKFSYNMADLTLTATIKYGELELLSSYVEALDCSGWIDVGNIAGNVFSIQVNIFLINSMYAIKYNGVK